MNQKHAILKATIDSALGDNCWTYNKLPMNIMLLQFIGALYSSLTDSMTIITLYGIIYRQEMK